MSSTAPVRFADRSAMLMAGIRRTHSFSEVPTAIPAQWGEFMVIAAQIGDVSKGTYGVICGADPAEEWLEYMSAVEVSRFDGLAEEIGRVRVPAAPSAVFEHRGPVAAIGVTWQAILNDWLPASGRTPANSPDFEFYGDEYDPVTASGLVEIWLPVEKSV
ncbi:MAG: GyrI-like domain-containing protein [Woeseiaceae bacterium]